METDKGEFYVGRGDDDKPLVYEADNLTTHGVIVGMTGSGKTGLGIDLIEEALLSEIPCLIIDPKGDMGNLLLNFPDFAPSDFEPWIDQATASREGASTTELATKTAGQWKTGLEGHGIGPDRMRRVKEGTEITIYTPGSAAGVGLNVLGSLHAPDLDWGTQAEVIRDEIEALVSSVLVLADVESDPVSGAEHILASTIIETSWRAGKDLDLAGLIGQIPKPPFRKLGVFDVDTFFPEQDRMELALRLNGLLASPSFAAWLEGAPLDIESMIGGDGPTKAAVVYLSHLSDLERQFLVTLLLSKMVTWIRQQPGTSELRALVYMDEVFGFAPPTAEPPSKKPILTILKQARAHGVGMVLSTQNPVDLDYKAMSNAGTWMVGRLQTENDKRRILEGMESATGEVDVDTYDKLISNLEKRRFVLHSTRAEPLVFGTRWAMSYLAGPFTRDQVTRVMEGRRPAPEPIQPGPGPISEPVVDDAVAIAPRVADGVAVRFLDPGTPWAGQIGADPTSTRYEPAAVTTVQLLYDDTKAGVNHTETYEAVIYPLDETVDPGEVLTVDHDERDFGVDTPERASFVTTGAPLQNKSFWSGLESDLKNHLVAHRSVEVLHNPVLAMYSRVGEIEEEFVARCRQAAEDAADVEMAKLKGRLEARIEQVKDQISTADARVRELEADVAASQQEELMSGAGDLLGAFLGGRRSSNPLGKAASRRAATQKVRARADSATQRLTDKQADLAELEDELAEAISEISNKYETAAQSIETFEIGLEKTDVRVAELKLVWVPV